MNRTTIIVVVIVIVLLLGGGAAMYLDEQTKTRLILRDRATAYGVDPNIVDAIGKIEGPDWNLGATNLTGPDLARGGAYGPTQITAKTARAYGYTGDMAAMADPVTAAEWTAIILAARPGGPPTTPEDAAAWWNAGHASMDTVAADNTARTKYLPRLRAAYAWVISNPPDDGSAVA